MKTEPRVFNLIKKNSKYVINILIVIVLGFVLYSKVPTIFNSYRLESSKLENTSVRRLSGEEISIPDVKRNKIVIFWATWCEPCHVEMKKLNNMLLQGQIKPDDLIAISVDEKKEDILKFIQQESYQFLIAQDIDGRLSRKFNISATPTILFVNKNGNLDWVSTGISLSLEKRVKDFLKK